MALTAAEYLTALEEERDVLQAKLKAIADVTDFSAAGSKPNAPANVDHAEFYDRWQRRLKTINEEIDELQSREPYMREGRGVA